jgi:hypothetical protein
MQGSGEHPTSLRNGLTTYSALSLVIGFLATIVPEKLCFSRT